MKKLFIIVLSVLMFAVGCAPEKPDATQNVTGTHTEQATQGDSTMGTQSPNNTATNDPIQSATATNKPTDAPTQGGSTVTQSPNNTATNKPTATPNQGGSTVTQSPNNTATNDPVPSATATNKPTAPTTTPGEQGQSITGKNTNMLCGIDMHGRVFMPANGTNDKQVGIYYFVWHGMDSKMTGTYNNTELLKNNPDLLWNPNAGPQTDSPANAFHYWDEPLFGYYKSTDRWVIAKQMEMLTLADIDFLYIDVTNADPYFSSCEDLFAVLKDMYNKGWDAPKVVFYTNSYSILTIQRIYEKFYTKSRYDVLWYRPDGQHPMMIGNYLPDMDKAEAQLRGDYAYDPAPLSKEITDMLDLRASQWPFDPFKQNGIPWNEWSYPQPIHNGVMNVSLAQHPNYPFSNSVAIGRHLNWGRGYNFTTKQNVEADAAYGTNFQSQWDTVHSKSNMVNMVTVTGWNEWTAIKLIQNGKVIFVDNFNAEFSRDIEPQRNGGYQDSYYLQLIDNVRRFKNTGKEIPRPNKVNINVANGSADFSGVTNVYYTGTLKSYSRNSTSPGNKYTYTQDAPRNNLQSVKVADDGNNLYFLIESEKDMVSYREDNFTNIYIGVDNLELKGWEGYEFVASPSHKKLYSLAQNGNRTLVGNIEAKVEGKYLIVSVPLSMLGATDGVYFKVADNLNSLNIMDTYTQGKCLPMGRLSWYYYLAK